MFAEISNKWNLPMCRMHLSMLPELINRINDNYKMVAFDIETTGLNLVTDSILGFGLCFENEKAYYIDLSKEPEWVVVAVFEQLKNLKVRVLIHNSMFDICFIGVRYKVDLSQLDIIDTLIVEHTVNTHKQYYQISLGLKNLAMEYTRFGDYEGDLENWKVAYCKEHKIKKDDFSYGMIPTEILEPYCCMDVIVTYQIYLAQAYQINRHVSEGWSKLPHLIRIKHDANTLYMGTRIRGLKINRAKLKEIGEGWEAGKVELLEELNSRIEVKLATREIKRRALTKKQDSLKNRMKLSQCRKVWRETEFNFSSVNHKRVLFFEVMGLAPKGKTKTGFSVDADFISYYTKSNRVCELLDNYSSLEKGITSFYYNILNKTSDEYSRVHPNINICGTVSSRTAGSDPK